MGKSIFHLSRDGRVRESPGFEVMAERIIRRQLTAGVLVITSLPVGLVVVTIMLQFFLGCSPWGAHLALDG